MAHFDAIVLGLGGMGSATVYHLARRGVRTLGVERFGIPHALGSSHGVNRIIRLAYAEHPAYVPLLRRAYELWRELERVSGEPLLFVTGAIDAGREDSATIRGSLLSCTVHDLPHELLDARELHRRFPGYDLPPDMVGVLQPDGGFVLAERTIVAHVEAALAAGAEVHGHERVLALDVTGSGVTVRTDRDTYRADRAVVTAGSWVGALLPPVARVAEPERQVLIWSQPRQPDLFRLGRFPVFNLEAPEGRFYGFPVHAVPGFKMGKYHHRRERVDPDTMDRGVHPEDEAVLREGIRKYFPAADGPTLGLQTCLFTNTPDEHFILDLWRDQPRVAIAAGFSGHGYKFCSVVGEIMADLVLKGGSRLDLELFRLNRFARSAAPGGQPHDVPR